MRHKRVHFGGGVGVKGIQVVVWEGGGEGWGGGVGGGFSVWAVGHGEWAF